MLQNIQRWENYYLFFNQYLALSLYFLFVNLFKIKFIAIKNLRAILRLLMYRNFIENLKLKYK